MNSSDETQPHCSIHETENNTADLKQREGELNENQKACFEEIENGNNQVGDEEEDQQQEEDDEEEDDIIGADLINQAVASSLADDTQSSEQASGLQKLIMKQKIELSQELRRLQFGNRSVSSQETKERLEQFFSRFNTETINTPTPATNTFRTANVQSEIEELNSRQTVSTVLSTNRPVFERTLQNFLANRQRPSGAQLEQARPPAPPPINQLNPAPIRAEPRLIEQYAREQVIDEISELVHRQVVTETLQSEFRTRLENRVLDYLRRSGTNGENTRQAIRQLAATTNTRINRNDFADLGITGAELNDNIDSASTYSETRGQQRATARNTREIKELKSEINELKSLMKLSFELQLDMQRSLKQEINALIANTFQNTASASLLRQSNPSNEGSCLICTEAQVDTVFYKCGHMCACYACSMTLKQKSHNCPVCRAPIIDIVRAYKTNMD